MEAKIKLRMMRLFVVGGGLMATAAPGTAFAHDNLGDDELAVANWMLVAALVTIVLGVLWGIWAFRNGQFSNIEASKYTMLEQADDYDTIMAEWNEQERARKAAQAEGNVKPATPAPASRGNKPAKGAGHKTAHV